MSNDKRLKACPFCGGDNIRVDIEKDEGKYYGFIYCRDCDTQMPGYGRYADADVCEEKTKYKWNTRSQPEVEAKEKPVCDRCERTVEAVYRTVPKGETCREWYCDVCINELGISEPPEVEPEARGEGVFPTIDEALREVARLSQELQAAEAREWELEKKVKQEQFKIDKRLDVALDLNAELQERIRELEEGLVNIIETWEKPASCSLLWIINKVRQLLKGGQK